MTPSFFEYIRDALLPLGPTIYLALVIVFWIFIALCGVAYTILPVYLIWRLDRIQRTLDAINSNRINNPFAD